MARLMRSVDRGLLWRYLGFTATHKMDADAVRMDPNEAVPPWLWRCFEDGRENLEQCGLMRCFSRANNCREQPS